MTTVQLITLITAIAALLGHVPAAVNALRSLTGKSSAPAVTQATSNAPQTPSSAP